MLGYLLAKVPFWEPTPSQMAEKRAAPFVGGLVNVGLAATFFHRLFK